jgi:hypothetical protein
MELHFYRGFFLRRIFTMHTAKQPDTPRDSPWLFGMRLMGWQTTTRNNSKKLGYVPKIINGCITLHLFIWFISAYVYNIYIYTVYYHDSNMTYTYLIVYIYTYIYFIFVNVGVSVARFGCGWVGFLRDVVATIWAAIQSVAQAKKSDSCGFMVQKKIGMVWVLKKRVVTRSLSRTRQP